MMQPIPAVWSAVLLFVGMSLLLEIGRWIGNRRASLDPEGARPGANTLEGALFALFGLLLAFSFSGAASRFDARRHLIVEEANCIGTAWLRLDLLPDTAQPALRARMREYLDARISVYRKLPDMAAAELELARGISIQGDIWKEAVAACSAKNDSATTVLVATSLNQMIDITTTRTAATRIHPPAIAFVMLFALALGCSFLAGYAGGGWRSHGLPHRFEFALAISFAIYVILELEFPRMGLIRVDAADQVLVALRASMG